MKRHFMILVALALLLAAPAALGEGDTFTLSLVGDVSIGDAIQYRTTASSYHAAISREGMGWPFSLVQAYFQEDDLTLANLEAVFTTLKKGSDKRYNLVAAPAHVQALKQGGIDLVNTVNNHAQDFGLAGYEQSIAVLDEAGIGRFGSLSFREGEPHDQQAVREVQGVRIGFLGYSYPSERDAAHIARRIQALKAEQGCQLVVVSLHWGREEHKTPGISQAKLAAQVMDAGADVVWGHHPHILQPIQLYQGKPVLYSTGNFTFGTMSPVDPDTGIFQLRYRVEDGAPVLEELRVIPCRTTRSPDFRPYELTEEKERLAVFRKLRWGKSVQGFDNLPASFLQTGIVRFD